MYVWPDMSRHMQRTTVRLPDHLLARAKQKAAADGTTLTALIEEGLRLVLLPRTSAGSARGPGGDEGMPVSRHTGGLMPGIDPIKLNTQTQEMDDLEMVERLLHQWSQK